MEKETSKRENKKGRSAPIYMVWEVENPVLTFFQSAHAHMLYYKTAIIYWAFYSKPSLSQAPRPKVYQQQSSSRENANTLKVRPSLENDSLYCTLSKNTVVYTVATINRRWMTFCWSIIEDQNWYLFVKCLYTSPFLYSVTFDYFAVLTFESVKSQTLWLKGFWDTCS